MSLETLQCLPRCGTRKRPSILGLPERLSTSPEVRIWSMTGKRLHTQQVPGVYNGCLFFTSRWTWLRKKLGKPGISHTSHTPSPNTLSLWIPASRTHLRKKCKNANTDCLNQNAHPKCINKSKYTYLRFFIKRSACQHKECRHPRWVWFPPVHIQRYLESTTLNWIIGNGLSDILPRVLRI